MASGLRSTLGPSSTIDPDPSSLMRRAWLARLACAHVGVAYTNYIKV